MEPDIDPLFKVHQLNSQGMEKAHQIGEAFDLLLRALKEACPEGTREFSLAKTKLEEACFFAKKAMASKPENQA